MYPIRKSMTQFGFPILHDNLHTQQADEYIYVDDPKHGNASSAEDENDKQDVDDIRNLPTPRLSKSAGLADVYMRSKARRRERGKLAVVSDHSGEEDEDCYPLPWRLVPDNLIEGLEFYKNADNTLRDQIQRTTQLVFVEKEGKGMVPKLKDPINLFPKELGPQQAARWPADIQVIEKRIKHIQISPNEGEPFYKVTGYEKSPMVRGEDRGGRLVYMYEPRSTFFVRSRVGGIKAGPEQCAISIDRSHNDTTLVFESRFESGNLSKAVQVSEFEYELWLRYDLYTSKHTQWFYFSVSNTRPNQVYRFTIVNFMKPDSLYNNGMRPICYSEKEALKKVGWKRCGDSIKYYRNNTKYETSKGDKPLYSLTWTTEFVHKNDTVYFAHCYPYTYTDLQDYLLDLSNDPIKSKICKQRVLCRTLAGNLVYLLTITSPSTNPEDIKHKKAVVLTARVHPGETNASWMMKGFLDYLTSNSADSKLLRDTFIFKVVPMLNPDGVIVGNYRCSLAGRDLNRNYKTVLKDAYPTVWHTKQMIRRLLQEREIVAYCDLHGHSRRQNVFIYGCENRHNAEKRLKERIFPCMLNKNSPDKFNFDACKFKIQKSKEGTGRVVMWNMGILNSYTMEATFCGSTQGKKKGFHFSQRDFEEMGYDFCDTLLDYCDPDKTKCANVLYNLEENLKQEIRRKLQMKGVSLDNVDLSVEDLSAYELESSDGGSDSSVSDGPPVHMQFQPQRVPKKKKKLKSRKERDRVKEAKDPKKGSEKDKPSTEDQRKMHSGHQSSHSKNDKHNYLEQLTDAYLRKGVIQKPKDQAPAHLRYSGTSGKPPQGLALPVEGLCRHHEQAFAAQLMAQQLQNMTGAGTNELHLDELMRQSSSSPNQNTNERERRHSRHLVEVSEAQKRAEHLQQQQMALRKPPAISENRSTSRSTVEDDKHADIIEEASAKGSQVAHKGRKHSGRKSRMGMRDSDEEFDSNYNNSNKAEGPDYVQDPHRNRPPRVKSAKSGDKEINSAIQSIKDLRQSLATSAANSNLTPTAGNYIKKLIKHELKQTDEDIDQITSRLQNNIDEKQRQYDQLMHANSNTDDRYAEPTSQTPMHRADSVTRSAPVANTKDRSSLHNRVSTKPEQTSASQATQLTRTKSERRDMTSKRDTHRLDRTASVMTSTGNKASRSAGTGNNNMNGNALVYDGVQGNNKLVDTYHIPEATLHSQGNKQTGFHGRKLQHEDSRSKLQEEEEYGYNVKPGSKQGNKHDPPHHATAEHSHHTNGTASSVRLQSQAARRRALGTLILPRSASSSSGRDEYDPQYDRATPDRNDRMWEKDGYENNQRVKSGKNSSRQVVGKGNIS